MARDLPETRVSIEDARYHDSLQVVSNCADCEADIELRTRVIEENKRVFLPLTNDEMQQIVLIWLKNLPSKEQAERMFSIAGVLAEEYEKEEAERTT